MPRSPRDYVWPAVGAIAVLISAALLYKELRGISFGDVVDSLDAIPPHRWVLAVGSAFLAYAALAWYERIALLHLGREKDVSWLFAAVCSFTTYALAHNIGASVFSGAVVRYRAYRTKGLTPAEIGVLVALCAFTFALGTILLGGLLMVLRPDAFDHLVDLPVWTGSSVGYALLALVLAYVVGSWLHLKPISILGFHLYYPRLPIVARQLVAGPLELVGAAAIIYFALPSEGNPGFVVILAIFVVSFSVALISHAPGGIGVLEYLFVAALPHLNPADVLAALIVFRLLYLLVPLAISLVVVLLFERAQLRLLDRGPAGTDRA